MSRRGPETACIYAGDDPVNGSDPTGLDCGLFSVVCAAYDATAGGVKTAGTSIYNGLNMAGVGIYNGAEYSGAFLWDTAYALAGQPGPYCGIWGAAGLANGIDFIAPLFGGGEGGYGASNAVNDESEGLSAEGAIPLEAEASALLRPGELVDQVIQTPGGPVQVQGDVASEGTTISISDLLIYPENAPGSIEAGPGPLKGALDALSKDAAAQGYDTLRLDFYRSTGANPGTERSITISLARYR
jgi:hypothetical protein